MVSVKVLMHEAWIPLTDVSHLWLWFTLKQDTKGLVTEHWLSKKIWVNENVYVSVAADGYPSRTDVSAR